MLDDTTKKKINTLRDILVGKVSDPKSQVEQITIALFYKFMEDMDNELINELGAEAKFFSGKYAKYSWKNLFAPSLGGEDMLNLYREAVEGMEINPNIPSAFRDIFKRAYLPYNDPATLKMFLKVVNDGFHYAHSEMLGDAFEYLLSILGTQGDAGQFRTPRHIIDFIAACVNPQKEDVICDPACGTAGFVIAAYKHILKQNTKKNSGDLLSPDDKKRIAQNLIGLDIDPMMVKLALANMYLHGFQDPHIYEYDSLTSEDRWADTYDVVLANPPFMTPKGGIRPHKRFTTQATKAEVLFVDLISTHLTANGRAGIIVPNGIIATTQNSYKDLRKLLVNDSLIAVISLPAGVFQPYSGVKTSILILDKALSKKNDSILFIKIENDGFDLGAQRREIDKNDLPSVLKVFNSYKESLVSGKIFDKEKLSSFCQLVKKNKILSNKDFVLSSDRYAVEKISQTVFDVVKLGDIAEVISGQSPESQFYNEKGDGCPFYQGRTDFGNIYLEKPTKWTTHITREANKNDILMSVRAPVGPVNISTEKICIGRGLAAIRPNENTNQFYLFYILRSLNGKIKGNGGAVFDSISREQIKEIAIPLPPLQIQEQIVAEIDGYQKIIDGAKMVVDNYKPSINIKPEWEMVELGEIATVISGFSFSSGDFKDNESVKSVKITNVGVNKFVETNKDCLPLKYLTTHSKFIVNKGDIVIALTRTVISEGLKVCVVCSNYDNSLLNQRVAAIKDKGLGNINFIYNYLRSDKVKDYVLSNVVTNMQPNLSIKDLEKLPIPTPTIEEQKEIMRGFETEQKIVEGNKQLIKIYKQKIQNRIAQVWGEE